MIDLLNQLFAYEAWAAREVLASFRAAANLPPKAVKLFAHILPPNSFGMSASKASRKVFPRGLISPCNSVSHKLRRLPPCGRIFCTVSIQQRFHVQFPIKTARVNPGTAK